jgi:hypothetical protein
MKELSVYEIGGRVLLDGRIAARITKIEISGDSSISYECVWWSEDTRMSEWVDACEVLPDGDNARAVRVDPVL